MLPLRHFASLKDLHYMYVVHPLASFYFFILLPLLPLPLLALLCLFVLTHRLAFVVDRMVSFDPDNPLMNSLIFYFHVY